MVSLINKIYNFYFLSSPVKTGFFFGEPKPFIFIEMIIIYSFSQAISFYKGHNYGYLLTTFNSKIMFYLRQG